MSTVDHEATTVVTAAVKDAALTGNHSEDVYLVLVFDSSGTSAAFETKSVDDPEGLCVSLLQAAKNGDYVTVEWYGLAPRRRWNSAGRRAVVVATPDGVWRSGTRVG